MVLWMHNLCLKIVFFSFFGLTVALFPPAVKMKQIKLTQKKKNKLINEKIRGEISINIF